MTSTGNISPVIIVHCCLDFTISSWFVARCRSLLKYFLSYNFSRYHDLFVLNCKLNASDSKTKKQKEKMEKKSSCNSSKNRKQMNLLVFLWLFHDASTRLVFLFYGLCVFLFFFSPFIHLCMVWHHFSEIYCAHSSARKKELKKIHIQQTAVNHENWSRLIWALKIGSREWKEKKRIKKDEPTEDENATSLTKKASWIDGLTLTFSPLLSSCSLPYLLLLFSFELQRFIRKRLRKFPSIFHFSWATMCVFVIVNGVELARSSFRSYIKTIT